MLVPQAVSVNQKLLSRPLRLPASGEAGVRAPDQLRERALDSPQKLPQSHLQAWEDPFHHQAGRLHERPSSVPLTSRSLDHSSLAVTTVYLRRLEGQEDRGWGRVAEALGV